jgi:hypothetical protein
MAQDETPAPGEPNPYDTAERDPAEVAGRRKAAWTIGVTCGICIMIGVGCYVFAAWAVFFSGR